MSCKSRTLDPGGTGTGTLPVGGGGVGMGGVGTGGAGGTTLPPDLGKPCTTAADCTTGFCADGVCCTSPCDQPCERCDGAGAMGACVSLRYGDPPKTPGGCPVEPASTCGSDGLCDGSGGCRVRPYGASCGFPGTCYGDVVSGADICDGHRVCKVAAPTICAPFRCDTTTAACLTTCTVDADCTSPPCVNGSCMPRSPETCSSDAECLSNHCAQGVCCTTACDGVCMTCNRTGYEGTCTPRPSGTNCGQPTCADGVATGLKRCDTAGHCDDWAPEVCAPFICDPQSQLCRDACAGDQDCAPTYACVAGSCGQRESPTCHKGEECDSGFCSRGVCCNAACDDPCHTCTLAGSIGVCQLNPVGCGMASDGGLP